MAFTNSEVLPDQKRQRLAVPAVARFDEKRSAAQVLAHLLLALDSAQRRDAADAAAFGTAAEELRRVAADLEVVQERLRQGGKEAEKVLAGEEVDLEELAMEASAVSDLEGLVDVRQRLVEIEQEEARLKMQKREAETVKAEKEEQFVWLSRTWNEAALKAEDGGKRAEGLMKEALAKMEAAKKEEEKARHEAEEKARKEAEERARKEAEEKARREAEELARKQAAEKARREAEEVARKEAEEKARKDLEERVRKEAEAKARKESVDTSMDAKEAHEVKEKPEVKRKQLESTADTEKLKVSSFSMDLLGRLLVRAELCPEVNGEYRQIEGQRAYKMVSKEVFLLWTGRQAGRWYFTTSLDSEQLLARSLQASVTTPPELLMKGSWTTAPWRTAGKKLVVHITGI